MMLGGARRYDVVIAGAGPAGLTTALNLLRARPYLAGRIAAIDKAKHPRVKVCAGGLIPRTVAALGELGLELDIPAVKVFGATARTEAGTIDLPRSTEPLCTIVRRNEFDALLARAACRAGLQLIENVRILGVEQGASTVTIATDRGVFEAQLLVGADGSGSKVQTAVFGRSKRNLGRALMADVPVDPACAEEFIRRIYRFDFNCVSHGVRGYCWSFPCVVDGQPCLNLGIYDQGVHQRAADGQPADLLSQLRVAFPELSGAAAVEQSVFKAFPIRWYERKDHYVCGRTLLAGDAAGVDPLMGEGISCAFEHGRLAAGAIAAYLDGDRRALEEYGNRLHHGFMGRKLKRLGFAARRFYGPRHRIYFSLARLSAAAQELGVDWYNGTRGADELSLAQAVVRLFSAVLSSRARVRV